MNMMTRCFVRSVFAIALSLTGGFPTVAADAWSGHRGPNAQGIANARGVPLRWSESEHVTWKTSLSGQGWSSPISAQGSIFLTTALEAGKSLHVLKVDFVSGNIVWDIEVFTNTEVPACHARNSHASPTPVIEDDRLYVHFGSMGTACVSAVDGRKLWENRGIKIDHETGAGGSPTLCGNSLILACDGVDAQYELALDKMTGKVLRQTERSGTEKLQARSASMRKSFGTPLILDVDGQLQCITSGAERLYATDPVTGKELWFVDHKGFSNASMPVTDGQSLIVPTGFMKPEIWAIRLAGARGDIASSHVLWKVTKGAPTQPSPLLFDGRLYMVNDAGILTCLEAATGKELWKERIGTDFAASPIFVDGRIYFFDCRGKSVVIEPGATYKQLAENELADGFMASPAVVGKSLVLRTTTSLYRID